MVRIYVWIQGRSGPWIEGLLSGFWSIDVLESIKKITSAFYDDQVEREGHSSGQVCIDDGFPVWGIKVSIYEECMCRSIDFCRDYSEELVYSYIYIYIYIDIVSCQGWRLRYMSLYVFRSETLIGLKGTNLDRSMR